MSTVTIGLLVSAVAWAIVLWLWNDRASRRRLDEAGRALRRSEERFQGALNNIPDVVVVYDRDLRIRYINSATLSLTGRPVSDFIGRRDQEIWSNEVCEAYLPALRTALETRAPTSVETELLLQGSESRRLKITCVPLLDRTGEVRELLGITHDLTERHRVELALRESEASLSRAQRVARLGSWELDLATGIPTWSAEMYRVMGLDPAAGAMTMAQFLEWVHPEDRSVITGRYAYVIQTGEPTSLEFRGDPARGPIRHTLINVAPIHDAEGRVVKLAGTLQDVTERKLAEESLRESERHYQELFSAHPLPMWVYDLESLRFLAANQAAVRKYGWSREEFLAMTLRDIRPPEDIDRLEENVETSRHTGGYEESRGWRHRTREGRIVDVEISSHDIRWQGRAARVVVAQDVTERLQLELQMRQAQKMEAVGRLAGGVAHDFNNLLGVIFGYSDMLLRDCPADDPRHRKLVEIHSSAARGADLTRQLLAFSRKQVVQPKVLDLNEVLAEADKLLQRLIGEDVRLVTKAQLDLGRIEADPGQIEQIVMNLAVNARDAMPDGGHLTIETANADLDEDYARRHPPLAPGRFVMLGVSDTGCGMDDATKAQIFDPFFTTKPVGKGTGLGLATVYGIVKQNNGFVWVYSEVGVGTTFKIYLPRVDDATSTREQPPPAAAQRGAETILLVEDQDSAREVLAEILGSLGYRVLAASNGEEALGIANRITDEISLVLTDVIMPGMNGRVLADRLVETRPRLRVLYMSGYTADAVSHHGVLDAGVALIDKPGVFVEATLAAKLREILDAPGDKPSRG